MNNIKRQAKENVISFFNKFSDLFNWLLFKNIA